MPTNIKIIVSALIVLAALVAAYFEHQAAGSIKWFIIGLGLFMAGSLWIFPEPKKEARPPEN
mgnify:CR=1 FL=1|jgi:apolipoprotein N-acyltransferase